MKCDYTYCIYNQDYACIFDDIQIDSLGMCRECIIISIPEEELNSMKENQK